MTSSGQVVIVKVLDKLNGFFSSFSYCLCVQHFKAKIFPFIIEPRVLRG